MTWISRPSGTTSNLMGVAYNGEIFIATGDNSTMLKSPDGANWQPGPHLLDYVFWRVTFCNNLSIAVGFHGVYGNNECAIMISTDGTDQHGRDSSYPVTIGR